MKPEPQTTEKACFPRTHQPNSIWLMPRGHRQSRPRACFNEYPSPVGEERRQSSNTDFRLFAMDAPIKTDGLRTCGRNHRGPRITASAEPSATRTLISEPQTTEKACFPRTHQPNSIWLMPRGHRQSRPRACFNEYPSPVGEERRHGG